jgi:uncharacterized SAM-binding protein YcdF (DUF218 family)
MKPFTGHFFVRWSLNVFIALGVLLGSWILWGDWPNPKAGPIPWTPEAIVVLGGGDSGRLKRAAELAARYPRAKVIVTGERQDVLPVLAGSGLGPDRLQIEESATSTFENARFTKPLLEAAGVRRAVLVTDWYHAPRTFASFRKVQPGVHWWVDFIPAEKPLAPEARAIQRRERAAAVYYIFRHGIWAF